MLFTVFRCASSGIFVFEPGPRGKISTVFKGFSVTTPIASTNERPNCGILNNERPPKFNDQVLASSALLPKLAQSTVSMRAKLLKRDMLSNARRATWNWTLRRKDLSKRSLVSLFFFISMQNMYVCLLSDKKGLATYYMSVCFYDTQIFKSHFNASPSLRKCRANNRNVFQHSAVHRLNIESDYHLVPHCVTLTNIIRFDKKLLLLFLLF